MNRIYRVVWNRFRRCLVAVNETVSSARQASGKTIGTAAVVAGLTAAVMIPAEALAGRIDTGTISGTETYSADDYISLGTHGMELTITSTGDYTIESNGTMLHAESDVFYNSGVLTITGSGEHQFDDWGYNAVENYAGAVFNSDIATMTMSGGNSWLKNWGTANIDVQNFVNNSANVVNYAGGVFNLTGNLTNAANLTNEGTFNNLGVTKIASGGTLTNSGEFSGVGILTLEAGGTLFNTGRASYKDMNVAAGGSSVNDGYESGNVLTVEGSHRNSGLSIWNGMLVEESGRAVNAESGSADINGTFVVRGEYENRGRLDAEGTSETIVVSTLVNRGEALYGDMVVSAGAKSENVGSEAGNYLTVEGRHINAGASAWASATVTGSAENAEGASLAIGSSASNDVFEVTGTLTNSGTLTASAAENAFVSGEVLNNAEAAWSTLSILSIGRSVNNGREAGGVLKTAGEYVNDGTAEWNTFETADGLGTNRGTLKAESFKVSGGVFSNTGTVQADDAVVSGGLLHIESGSAAAEKLTLSGGDLVVGSGSEAERTGEERVDLDLSVAGRIDGRLWISKGGDVSFGPEAAGFASAASATDIPDVASRITVTSGLTVSETGSIAIGEGVWTSAESHASVTPGSLYFAEGSLAVIDSASLGHETAAFTGTNAGSVTVESGAKLMLGGITEEGDYIIADGFATAENKTDGVWTGGWSADDLLAPNTDGSGLNWELTLNSDKSKIWVTALFEDIRNKYPDVVIPTNVNEQLDQCKSAGTPDSILTCAVIKNHELSTAEKTRILNSVAEISYAGASMAMALGDLEDAAESIESRASMRSEAFTGGGLFRRARRSSGNALWADILGGKHKADSLSLSGNVKSGYDADSYGIIVGADRHLRKSNLMIGFAASYSKGSLDSTGDLLKTSNDFSSYGFHLYGAWKPGFLTNVIGTVSYQRSSSEITQTLPGGLPYSRAETSADTDLIALGIRAERHALFGPVAFIPHIGLRAVYGKGAGFETKLDGSAAYSMSPDATFTFGLPIGLTVRGDILTRSGWNFAPTADLTLTPQFGDRSQDMIVTGIGSKKTDSLTGDFTSGLVTRFSLGLEATNAKNLTFGARYGFAKGGEGRTDQNLRLEVRKLW